MRRSTRTLVLCGSVLFLWSCNRPEDPAAGPGTPAAGDAAAPAVAAEIRPARRSGLWEHTVQTMGVTQTSRLCIDQATDKTVALWGQQAEAESGCERQNFTRTPAGYAFESVCPDGTGGTVTTRGTITGDFDTSYKLAATTLTQGSQIPQANREMQMEMSAAWKGPCPEGMKPGDIQVSLPGMPGGPQINLNDMAKMAEGAGR